MGRNERGMNKGERSRREGSRTSDINVCRYRDVRLSKHKSEHSLCNQVQGQHSYVDKGGDGKKPKRTRGALEWER